MEHSKISKARALQNRAFELAVQVVLLCRRLPRTPEAGVIRSQLLRAATSTAANYRSACRAHSPQAFVAKLSIALEEADETLLWLRLLGRVRLAGKEAIRPLANEADELVRSWLPVEQQLESVSGAELAIASSPDRQFVK